MYRCEFWKVKNAMSRKQNFQWRELKFQISNKEDIEHADNLND